MPGAGQGMGRYGRVLTVACKAAALAGALVFVALVLMSIVSISGRKLMSMPVPGDVEMLQLCAAFASASFFAWCHLSHGDVKVDFFTDWLPARAVHAMDCAGSLLVAEGVGGALVGGASLSAESFLAIVMAAAGPDAE